MQSDKSAKQKQKVTHPSRTMGFEERPMKRLLPARSSHASSAISKTKPHPPAAKQLMISTIDSQSHLSSKEASFKEAFLLCEPNMKPCERLSRPICPCLRKRDKDSLREQIEYERASQRQKTPVHTLRRKLQRPLHRGKGKM
jgi:hypothetical protein